MKIICSRRFKFNDLRQYASSAYDFTVVTYNRTPVLAGNSSGG